MYLQERKMDALPTSIPALRTVTSVRIRSFALSAQDAEKARHSLRSRRVGGGHHCKRLDLFIKVTNIRGAGLLGKHFAQDIGKC